MGNLGHQAARLAASKICDNIVKGLCKDPETEVVKLIDMWQKFMGDEKIDLNYDSARRMICDKDCTLNKYMHRLINEIDPHVLKTIALNLGFEAFVYGTKTIRKNREKYGCNVPWLILMDPTSACNLHCTGCWAAEYGHKLNLTFDEMDKVVTQGKELGVYLYMFTGGEPLVRKADLVKLCEKHNDCAFLAFTNGTLVDEAFCAELKRIGNLYLAISLEGFSEVNDLRRGTGVFAKVMHAMDLLKENGLVFGTSICYTSKNYETVTSDEFIDMIVEKGCRYALYFHYMPVGNDASLELLPNPKQRLYIKDRVREIRNMTTGKGIFTMDFQNDGEFVGGCIAGGRNYFHINSEGDAEPCVFIHYSDSNIREKSILECLRSPLFKEYYKGQPFNNNMLRPCPMLENPQALRKIISKTGAKSTNLNCPESAEELCAKCDCYAKAWAPKAKEIWENEEHFHPYTQYYRDTEEGKKELSKEQ